VREHRSHTVTKFVWGLKSKIRRAMITGSYDLDTVEEAFDVALKIDFTFKMLVNAKARCSKCEGYVHYDYQCLSKSRHVSIACSVLNIPDIAPILHLRHLAAMIWHIQTDIAFFIQNRR